MRTVGARLAEQQIIGAGLAGAHGVVLGANGPHAQGALGFELLAQLLQVELTAQAWIAVRTGATGDDRRDRPRRRRATIKAAPCSCAAEAENLDVVDQACARRPSAGGAARRRPAGRAGLRKPGRERRRIVEDGSDQVKAGGRFGHDSRFAERSRIATP